MREKDKNSGTYYGDNRANPHRRKYPDPTPVNHSAKLENDESKLKKATESDATVIGVIALTHF